MAMPNQRIRIQLRLITLGSRECKGKSPQQRTAGFTKRSGVKLFVAAPQNCQAGQPETRDGKSGRLRHDFDMITELAVGGGASKGIAAFGRCTRLEINIVRAAADSGIAKQNDAIAGAGARCFSELLGDENVLGKIDIQ